MAKSGARSRRIKIMLVSTGHNQKGKPTRYFYTTYKSSQTDKLKLEKFDPYAWNQSTHKRGMKVPFVEKKIPK